MTTDDQTAEPGDHVAGDQIRWDPAEIMRRRSQGTLAVRDDAIQELRALMTDEEALEEFGIDLGEIEK